MDLLDIHDLHGDAIAKALMPGKSLPKRLAAAGLAGSVALTGGAGAVKAAPSVVRAGQHAVDDVRYWGATGNPQTALNHAALNARRSGQPQTYQTLSQEDWIKQGRPGSSAGAVSSYKGPQSGQWTIGPDGSRKFTPAASGRFGKGMLHNAAMDLVDIQASHSAVISKALPRLRGRSSGPAAAPQERWQPPEWLRDTGAPRQYRAPASGPPRLPVTSPQEAAALKARRGRMESAVRASEYRSKTRYQARPNSLNDMSDWRA